MGISVFLIKAYEYYFTLEFSNLLVIKYCLEKTIVLYINDVKVLATDKC